MAQSSSIEWTESTWNPVIGCRKVSSGCANCYAERMAKRLAAMARSDQEEGRTAGRKKNYLHVLTPQGRWNGSIYLDESAIMAPMSWREPRTIFVNSMSDLFHEDVPSDFIRRIFSVMNQCSQHTFQVLTKRAERLLEVDTDLNWTENIWMGVSVEDQQQYSRIRALQQCHASTRFLSVEPLLGPVPRMPLSKIHWVIAGGESGPGARPMDPSWARQVRDRCIERGVPFFFKQWGGVNKKAAGRVLDGRTWDEMPNHLTLAA